MRFPFAILVPSAILVQGLRLAWLGAAGGGARWAGVALSVVAALGFAVAWRRWSPRPYVAIGLVTLSLGGLGMLLGTWIDGRLAGHPGHHGHGPAALASWMTVTMLLVCVPACAALCRQANSPLSAARQIAFQLPGIAGMLIGMSLGARLAAALVGDHLAMLLGMSGGSVGGLVAAGWLRGAVAKYRPSFGNRLLHHGHPAFPQGDSKHGEPRPGARAGLPRASRSRSRQSARRATCPHGTQSRAISDPPHPKKSLRLDR